VPDPSLRDAVAGPRDLVLSAQGRLARGAPAGRADPVAQADPVGRVGPVAQAGPLGRDLAAPAG
jgi:hypothetical protein